MSKVIRYFVPTTVRLQWAKKKVDREFSEKIEEARNTKEEDLVARLQDEHSFELAIIWEDQESFYTDQLLKKARRLRVSIPPIPKSIGFLEYEPSEDWTRGPQGSWCLTVAGIAKVREEIRREEKWRREGRAHWVLWLSAIGGVIGSLTGLVAVFLK